MPIVPKFTIDQNDEFVFISIRVPYIKVTLAELVTDGTDFTFYCKPYLLKLTFPYELEGEDIRCRATYDPDVENGTLVAHLPKKVIGQHFPDLDLTTNLLQTRLERDNEAMKDDPIAPSIEVVSSLNDGDCDAERNEEEQGQPDATSVQIGDIDIRISQISHYGFNNRYSLLFRNLKEEAQEILELADPDKSNHRSRRTGRLAKENEFFDMTRYLGDLFGFEDDFLYKEAIAYEPFWNVQWNLWKSSVTSKPISRAEAENSEGVSKTAAVALSSEMSAAVDAIVAPLNVGANVSSATAECGAHAVRADSSSAAVAADILAATSSSQGEVSSSDIVTVVDRKQLAFEQMGGFTELEAEIMSHKLARKEYLISSKSKEAYALFLGLADILFAFCYEFRITSGEFNVESVDNITRLSATFSWLDSFSFPRDSCRSVLIYSARRSLAYPYLRALKFTRKIWADVAKILVLGKKCILKCLLQLRNLFEHTDCHYLLNKLFVDDYCIWVQSVDAVALNSFGRDYNDAKTDLEKMVAVDDEISRLESPPKPVPSAASAQVLIQEISSNSPAQSAEVASPVVKSTSMEPKKCAKLCEKQLAIKRELGFNIISLETWALEGAAQLRALAEKDDDSEEESEEDDSTSDEEDESEEEDEEADDEPEESMQDAVANLFENIPVHIRILEEFESKYFDGDASDDAIAQKIEKLLL